MRINYMVAVGESLVTKHRPGRQDNLPWHTLLRRKFSDKEMHHAQVGVMAKPLQDRLVGFERFSDGDIMQMEVYRGKHGLSARLYFRRQPGKDFVPTYVVTTKTGLEALQRTESKLLIDPVLEGEVIQGNYGDVNLRNVGKRRKMHLLMDGLLSQPDLVYAERMTTHVYDGKDAHAWKGLRRLTIRRFRDQVDAASGKYTALVFRKNGKPLAKNVGALNVTNDNSVITHRPTMHWQSIY